MKQDPLEKFVSDNRRQFDDEEPSPRVWDALESSLPSDVKKPHRLNTLWRVAAAIALVVVSWTVFRWTMPTPDSAPMALLRNDIFPRQHIIQMHGFKDDKVAPVKKDTQQAIPQQTFVAVNDNPAALNSEFLEVDAYYTSQISLRKDELFSNAAADPGIRRQVNAEFKQIDSNIKELKRDMNDNINNREVVEALMQNYRVKLQLLENILQELNEKDANKR
jgi:hypothetical protein